MILTPSVIPEKGQDRGSIPNDQTSDEPEPSSADELRNALNLIFGSPSPEHYFLLRNADPRTRELCRLAFGERRVVTQGPGPQGANADSFPGFPCAATDAGTGAYFSIPVITANVDGCVLVQQDPPQERALTPGWTRIVAACATHVLNRATNSPHWGASSRKVGLRRAIISQLAIGAPLPAVANVMHISPSRCSHLVRELYGLSFSDLRDELRLERALELLVENNSKVDAVADCLGMRDTSYFYRFFRKKTGLTPKAFRETHLRSRALSESVLSASS